MMADLQRNKGGYFHFNNCKIANELRKYRDLTGCVNRVAVSPVRNSWRLSDAKGWARTDWVDYVITEALTFADMMAANAVYTFMTACPSKAGFKAGDIAQIMAGDPQWRSTPAFRTALEERLCRLAKTELYILADHDRQGQVRDLYEGSFLPIACERKGDGLSFRFLPGRKMPLYEYAGDKNQILSVPAELLKRSADKHGARRNNNEQDLALRHYLLQELSILTYGEIKGETKSRSKVGTIQLLRTDKEGREFGLLWRLGLLDEGQDADAAARKARRVHMQLLALLDGWSREDWLKQRRRQVTYQELTAEEGYGVRLWCQEEAQSEIAASPQKV